jgi:coenzyme Q-binding protein COQ10
MIISTPGRVLPFSCAQMFDLAADIERYPQFLRGWISARIIRRRPDGCDVDQVLGLGPVRLRFTSRATFARPDRIEVSSSEAPFRHFSLVWRIDAAGGGCRVGVTADVTMLSRLLQHVVDGALPAAVDDIVAAFEARARLAGAVRAPQPN